MHAVARRRRARGWRCPCRPRCGRTPRAGRGPRGASPRHGSPRAPAGRVAAARRARCRARARGRCRRRRARRCAWTSRAPPPALGVVRRAYGTRSEKRRRSCRPPRVRTLASCSSGVRATVPSLAYSDQPHFAAAARALHVIRVLVRHDARRDRSGATPVARSRAAACAPRSPRPRARGSRPTRAARRCRCCRCPTPRASRQRSSARRARRGAARARAPRA